MSNEIQNETNENPTKELAVFEEIRRDLTVANNNVKVPMAMVFGRGTVGNVQSFGGRSLAENTQKVDYALANVGELQTIWNHSHTQWMWKHLNLGWHAPMRNMRQISAEITAKKGALNEAKWKQVESELKIRKIEDELQKGQENGTLDYWREVELKVKLAKLKEGIAEGIVIIEGAMKDVLVLNELYEQLKEKVSGFSEADIEKEETKSHLKRALVQSIRDVRMSGAITKAEQEYIEQIGINPMKLQGILRAYVESEAKSDSWDVSGLYEFVDKLTDELVETYKVDEKRMALQGFSTEVFEQFAQSTKLALLGAPETEEKKEEE
jgi:hypothetical protein